ncbi:MAG: metallophosphoesterase [Candidatus Micrarchaeota archaeon]
MKFVANEPALVLGRHLIIADLHLGKEFEFAKKGVNLAPEPKKAAGKLNELLEKYECDSLVVLGDLKHDVTGFEEPERRVLREFLDALAVKDVTVVKGNHDSLIEGTMGLDVKPAEGFILQGGYGLFHGHAWPSPDVLNCAVLFFGHSHPMMAFDDGFDGSFTRKAWVAGNLVDSAERGTRSRQKFVLFPAFSDLVGGMALNSRDQPNDLIGPLMRNNLLDLQNAKTFLIDGSPAGAPVPKQKPF